jgi:manganese transport protein
VLAGIAPVQLVVLANHERLMGDLRNRWWQNVISVVGMLTILATCDRLVTTLVP